MHGDLTHNPMDTQPTVNDPSPIVLIVDDEAPIAEEIAEYLANQGLHTITAHDCASARTLMRGNPRISVLLTDVRIPDDDGVTLAGEVTSGRDEAHAIEVIVLTGHGNMDMAVDALRARVFDFLNKPLRLRKLGETVRAALASAETRRARARSSAAAGAASTASIMAVLNDELRTPLVPILGLSELMEQDGEALPGAQMATYAGLIRKSGERLKEVADIFALLSSLELGVARPAAELLRVDALLRRLEADNAAAARERSQTMAIGTVAVPSLTTDAMFLRLALDQLVSNAVRFTPEGGAITLFVQRRGAEAWCVVEDDGPGMDAAQLARAMHPVQPLNGALAHRHRGTGLGLTLAARLAQALGGRLELDSRPGSGTRAAIVLPIG